MGWNIYLVYAAGESLSWWTVVTRQRRGRVWKRSLKSRAFVAMAATSSA
jgi:hypothetical protein